MSDQLQKAIAAQWAKVSGIGNQDAWTEARAIVYRAVGFDCYVRIAALGERIMHHRQGIAKKG